MIYLDNAATTKMSDTAIDAMQSCMNKMYGNPSGIYHIGRIAKESMENARRSIAESIGARAENIFFTSGGTEADNWVLGNAKQFGQHIITSKIEHHAILNKCAVLEKEGMDVSYIEPDGYGMVAAEKVRNEIRNDTALISVMYANNEIGTIEPVSSIAAIAHENNVLFHTDAVQAAGHVPINVEEMNVDFLSASGHKFHGPKGVGFLYVREPEKITPFLHGGGQEKRKRAGTENVAGIVGMSAALKEAVNQMEWRIKKESEMRSYLIGRVLSEIPYVRLNGSIVKRLPGNANFSFCGINGTSLVILMDNDEICISAGSACSSGSDKPSHVITAIGVPEELAYGTVRITISSENTMDEINYVISRLKENVSKLRREK